MAEEPPLGGDKNRLAVASGIRPLRAYGRQASGATRRTHWRDGTQGELLSSAIVVTAPLSPGRAALVEDLEHAFYASKIVSYAQGFAQMAAAADSEGWKVDLGAMATIWRGGCIIRARFLDRIREAYDDEPKLTNLMAADFFAGALADAQDPWRRIVARGAELGIPTPAFSSALAYYDGYRRPVGPAGLIQGLRDLFGAHTYRRHDRDGAFHIDWSGDGSESPAGEG